MPTPSDSPSPIETEPGVPAPGGVIPLCIPEVGGNEWKYIKECLDTGWVSSVGAYVNRFEQAVADYVGARRAVAVVNGTAALHIALLAAGVEPEDEVLLPSLTFIAPANAIRYTGARPVFMDSEPQYWQMDPGKTVDFIENQCDWKNGELRNKTTGGRVRAIVPVHVVGHPVDMDPIVEAARKYGLKIIEDATESLGAKYKDRPTGSLGDAACFSFNGNKIITTGGGGMIVTDSDEWAEKAKYLTTQAKDDTLEYIHNEIGYNYRLSNVQAAMGCAQMEQLDGFVTKKRQIAERYDRAFSAMAGIASKPEAPWAFDNRWMYTVLVDPDRFGIGSRDLIRRLAEAKIQTRPLWQPLHLSPAHAESQSYHCETAESLARQAVSLPCSSGLTGAQQDCVLDAIRLARP